MKLKLKKPGDVDHGQAKDCKLISKSYKLYKAIVHKIRKRYKLSTSNDKKRMISRLVLRHRILKQYKLGSFARSLPNISRRHMKEKPLRKPNVQRLQLRNKVQEFFERDDVSMIKPDKKATITRKGVKKQIRLLTDDLKALHDKFISESSNISFSLFCKPRPFWTVKP